MTAAQRATAARMIGQNGQIVTITRTVEGAYDPATGTASVTTTVQTGTGCVFPYPPGLRNQPDSLIAENDQQLLLSALDGSGALLNPEPTVNDRVTLADASVHTIEAVQTLAPASIIIMYDCRIRGSA